MKTVFPGTALAFLTGLALSACVCAMSSVARQGVQALEPKRNQGVSFRPALTPGFISELQATVEALRS